MINNEQQQQAGTSAMSGLPPPSYESATYADATKIPVVDTKQPLPQPDPSATMAISHSTAVPATQAGQVTVYHYVHPVTQQRIDSLLPPSHPEMQCLQHGHIPRTRFGIAGILAAIFWFPLGLGCMLIDKDTRCERCKKVISGRLGSEP
ncbi:hypothetical protein M408DRAFT_21368 [Serendipita vermifera MAFF 305830]|uniref:Brain protein I3 n=1 Tax=Serendipita vermifera MAFF 305830 TaxID=933852 RepID=A0A0C3BGL9_SERVB|nr:hypothetical protein M408DRAFT_21368 [Serendipita vermifera MAFF 305830]